MGLLINTNRYACIRRSPISIPVVYDRSIMLTSYHCIIY